jgi:cytochrome c-type biogenesis protein CcmF
VLGYCGLVVLRRRALAGQTQIESAVSKEGTFLLTNLLFVAATIGILLGTKSRLLNDYAASLNASLAAPFFNRVGIPIFLLIILVMGICITLGWRRVALSKAARTLMWPAAACLLIGLALFIFLSHSWYAAAGIAVCCLVPITAAIEWVKSTAARHRSRGENYLKAFLGLIWADKPRHGGYIIHIAIALIAVGVIGSTASDMNKDVSLLPGESVSVGAYSVTYDKLNYDPTPGRMVFTADISVYKHDKLIAELAPSTYFDKSFNGEVDTPAIRSNPAGDIYVTVVGWNDTGLTEFNIKVIPLMMWVWIGGWVMALGGLIAFWPQKKAEAADAAAEE